MIERPLTRPQLLNHSSADPWETNQVQVISRNSKDACKFPTFLFRSRVCVYAHEHMQRPEERALDPLELELQAVGSCLVWMLGTELGSSTRSARPPNY